MRTILTVFLLVLMIFASGAALILSLARFDTLPEDTSVLRGELENRGLLESGDLEDMLKGVWWGQRGLYGALGQCQWALLFVFVSSWILILLQIPWRRLGSAVERGREDPPASPAPRT